MLKYEERNIQKRWNFLHNKTGRTTFSLTLIEVFMKTDNDQFTPQLDNLTINFRSPCLPDGQTAFSDLANGDYVITISKGGLETLTDSVSITSGWQEYDAELFFP